MESLNTTDAWKQESKTITVDELDQLVAEYARKREEYEEKKEISNEAYKASCDAEEKLKAALIQCGKTSYIVNGIGRTTVVDKLYVRVPRDNPAKDRLFDYIRSKYGVEALTGLQSINHNSLNSFVKSEMESQGAEFRVPGCEEIEHLKELRFSRKS